MARPRATRDDVAVMARLAGLDLTEDQFSELCRAYASIEDVLARLPTDLPYSAEPAHAFDPRRCQPMDRSGPAIVGIGHV